MKQMYLKKLIFDTVVKLVSSSRRSLKFDSTKSYNPPFIQLAVLNHYKWKGARSVEMGTVVKNNDFFFFVCFWGTSGSFCSFFLCCPSQRSARSQVPSLGGNPPGDWQSVVGWGDAGFEPGTAGQQPGTLPLSYHASQEQWFIYYNNYILLPDF